jgi:hypothetical protein
MPISGAPRLTFFIDPARPAIGIRLPKHGGETAPETDLENLHISELFGDDGRHFEVSVTRQELFLDAYPVLLAISDRLQLDKQSLAAALTNTVRILGHLLERRGALSAEKELGLYGELLLLIGLIRQVGSTEAMEAWRGPDREEHDFGLRGIDLEVKTTASERRAHWIGSLTQLSPVESRPLWLVSYQLTRAGPDDGRTLPSLISHLRDRLADTADRQAFERNLQNAGWHDSYETTCRKRWRNRSAPIPFAVVDGFPRLTRDLFAGTSVDLAYVTDVQYRLDLSGLQSPETVPVFLSAAITDGELL